MSDNSTSAKRSPELVIILHEGIRGHLNQSRGIAGWLHRLCGAEMMELQVPQLTGHDKSSARRRARQLSGEQKNSARKWLSAAGGEQIIREIGRLFAEKGIRENSRGTLFISAGSTPAPYNLALSILWGSACAVIMTPSVIGTSPFDFAIVPEHDCPPHAPNVLVTVGSPNNIFPDELKSEAEKLLSRVPPKSKHIWSILIGGDDANYCIPPMWIKYNVGRIVSLAEQKGADLYITTSRRTNAETEKMLQYITADSPAVRYLQLASADSFNCVPAMLGFSEEVFCTDDSVNMVSETITGGHRAILMRTVRRNLFMRTAQKMTVALADAGAVPSEWIWGVPKFDRVFEQFARHDALIEFTDWLRTGCDSDRGGCLDDESGMWDEFNEARRAAKWIIANWAKCGRKQ